VWIIPLIGTKPVVIDRKKNRFKMQPAESLSIKTAAKEEEKQERL